MYTIYTYNHILSYTCIYYQSLQFSTTGITSSTCSAQLSHNSQFIIIMLVIRIYTYTSYNQQYIHVLSKVCMYTYKHYNNSPFPSCPPPLLVPTLYSSLSASHSFAYVRYTRMSACLPALNPKSQPGLTD